MQSRNCGLRILSLLALCNLGGIAPGAWSEETGTEEATVDERFSFHREGTMVRLHVEIRSGEPTTDPDEIQKRAKLNAAQITATLERITDPAESGGYPIRLGVMPFTDEQGVLRSGEFLLFTPRPIGPGEYRLKITAAKEGYEQNEIETTLTVPKAPEQSAVRYLHGRLLYVDPRDHQTLRPVPAGTEVIVTEIWKMPVLDPNTGFATGKKRVETFAGSTVVQGPDGYFNCPVNLSMPTEPGGIFAGFGIDYFRVVTQAVIYDMATRGIKGGVLHPDVTTVHSLYRNISEEFLGVTGNAKDYHIAYLSSDGLEVPDDPVVKLPDSSATGPVEVPYEGYLTTDGYISPFASISAGQTQFNPSGFQYYQTGGYTSQGISGINYFNYNGVFSLLRAFGEAYDLIKSVALHDPREVRPEEAFITGPLAFWKPADYNAADEIDGVPGTHYQPRNNRIYIASQDTYQEQVVLQAYAAWLRNNYLQREATSSHLPGEVGNLHAAWTKGWDRFFACAVQNNPDSTYRETGTNFLLQVDLAETQAKGLDLWETTAAALWKIFNFYGEPHRAAGPEWHNLERNPWGTMWNVFLKLAEEPPAHKEAVNIQDFWKGLVDYTGAEAGSISSFYLNFVLKQIEGKLLELGMRPRPNEPFTKYPLFRWWRNSLFFYPHAVTYRLQFAKDEAFTEIVYERSGIPDQPDSQEFQINVEEVAGPSELIEVLEPELYPGDYYWRVQVEDERLPELHTPALRFTVPYPVVPVQEEGKVVRLAPEWGEGGGSATRQVGSRVTGQVNFPPGAVAGTLDLLVRPLRVTGELPGYAVIGEVLYALHPYATSLHVPATLTLNYAQADLLGWPEQALAIYCWNPERVGWDYVPSTVDPRAKVVTAAISRLGVYALLVETAPPVLSEVTDGPDPFQPGPQTCEIRYRLSKPARVTARIFSPDRKVVRTLAQNLVQTEVLNALTWDGRSDAGAVVADGRYPYQLEARDFSGNAATPVGGRIFVNTGPTGQIEGEVAVPEGLSPAEVQVAVADTTLSVVTTAEGRYTLPQVPPGDFTLLFSRSGLFPEELSGVKVVAGETTTASRVAMTNQVVAEVGATPRHFTPDGDGVDDTCLISYLLGRKATVEVRVLTYEGRLVRSLVEGEEQRAGRQVLPWDGKDRGGQPAGNGVYTVQVWAVAGGESLLQGAVEVVLDRGLLADLRVNPVRFAPGTEAIDQTAQVVYRLSDPGLVSVEVISPQGQVVRRLLDRAARAAGVHAETWEGQDEAGQQVPDGSYVLKVSPFFPEGTPSQARSVEVKVDTFTPVLSELTPANGSTVRTGRPTITCFVNRPGEVDPDSLRIKIDEYLNPVDEFDAVTGRMAFTPKTSLGAGTHIAIAYARSRAGTPATPISNAFTVVLEGKDETPPEVRDLKPINRPAPDFEQVYTQTPALEGRLFDSGSGIDKDSIILTIDGTTQILGVEEIIPGSSGLSWDRWHYVRAILFYNPLTGEFRYNPLTKLSNNALHFFTIEATDRAGNKVEGQTTFKVVLDTEAPTVVLSPADGETVKVNPPTVRATLSDGTGAVSGIDPGTLRLVIDGKAVERPWAYYDEGTGVLSYALPTALEENAQHIVTVDVADQAGNAAVQARSIFHLRTDDQPPSIYDLTPADGTRTDQKRPVVTARLVDRGDSQIDPASIVLKLDGMAQTVQYDAETQQVTYQPTEELALGRHLITLDVADTSRNRAAQAASLFEVAADITPPTITEVQPASGTVTPEVQPVISALLQDVGLGIDPRSLELKIDGQAVALPPGAFDPATGRLTYRPVEPFPERTQHIAVFSVKDRGGNPAVPATTLFAIQAFSGGAIQGTVTLEARQEAGGVVVAVEGTPWTAVTDAAGQYTLPSVPPGTYTVTARKEGFLVGKRRNVEVAVGALATVDLGLWAGDSNGDDRINLGDWALLTGAYGSQQGAANYLPTADFNQDGRVDEADVALFERNFGKYR